MIDKEESDNFYIDTLIKDKEDGQRVAEILLSKWDYIKVYHRHGQVHSDKYPQIGWDNVFA